MPGAQSSPNVRSRHVTADPGVVEVPWTCINCHQTVSDSTRVISEERRHDYAILPVESNSFRADSASEESNSLQRAHLCGSCYKFFCFALSSYHSRLRARVESAQNLFRSGVRKRRRDRNKGTQVEWEGDYIVNKRRRLLLQGGKLALAPKEKCTCALCALVIEHNSGSIARNDHFTVQNTEANQSTNQDKTDATAHATECLCKEGGADEGIHHSDCGTLVSDAVQEHITLADEFAHSDQATKFYNIKPLRDRFLPYDDAVKREVAAEAARKRLLLGERLVVQVLYDILFDDLAHGMLCQRHYMTFNGIAANLLFDSCSVCLRKTKRKDLTGAKEWGKGGDLETFVITETIYDIMLSSTNVKNCRFSQASLEESEPDDEGSTDEGPDSVCGFDDISQQGDDIRSKAKKVINDNLLVCTRCKMCFRRKLGVKFRRR